MTGEFPTPANTGTVRVLHPGEQPHVEFPPDWVGDGDGPWTVQERWLLTEGLEVIRVVAELDEEIRLGDLMSYAARADAELRAMSKSGGCLRLIVDQCRIFVAPPENVLGVYVEMLTPHGDPVEFMYPGYVDVSGPVDRSHPPES